MGSLFNYLINYDLIVVSMISSTITLVIALIFTFLISLKMHSSRSFFITSAITPMIVAVIISTVAIFLDNSTTNVVRIASIAVALGLIRFRSINGKAEEMLVLFAGIGIGVLGGFGLVAYAAIVAIVVASLYLALDSTKIFSTKKFKDEQLLVIVIPESLNYKDLFKTVFGKYLIFNELISVKTTNMGSLFKLTYHVKFKINSDEKAFLDEARTMNGNLEVSLIMYGRDGDSL